jgi:hypothetical protein
MAAAIDAHLPQSPAATGIGLALPPRSKLPLVGKNLDDYSLETVKMFPDDAIAAGFKL